MFLSEPKTGFDIQALPQVIPLSLGFALCECLFTNTNWCL